MPISFNFQKELNDPINHFTEKSWGHLRYDGTNLQRTQRNATIGEIAKNQERVLEFLICPNSLYMKILSNNNSGNETDFVVTSFLEIPSDFNVTQNLGDLSIIFGWVYLDQSPYFLPDILMFLKQYSVVGKGRNGSIDINAFHAVIGNANESSVISRRHSVCRPCTAC
ncbi:MAG: hypothetical protein LBH59_05230, partial [Planctomycetaceae bacterium]|nr:hypothetical protein [Planctomycetaceae bacterium]